MLKPLPLYLILVLLQTSLSLRRTSPANVDVVIQKLSPCVVADARPWPQRTLAQQVRMQSGAHAHFVGIGVLREAMDVTFDASVRQGQSCSAHRVHLTACLSCAAKTKVPCSLRLQNWRGHQSGTAKIHRKSEINAPWCRPGTSHGKQIISKGTRNRR